MDFWGFIYSHVRLPKWSNGFLEHHLQSDEPSLFFRRSGSHDGQIKAKSHMFTAYKRFPDLSQNHQFQKRHRHTITSHQQPKGKYQNLLHPGMKGIEQVAAGSTRLIQQGNILISEMESLPKRNLLPWCLPAASAWQRWIGSQRNSN